MAFRTAMAVVLGLAAALVQAQSVSLVSGDDYAPYADSQLPQGGMSTELVKRAFAQVGMDVTVDWLPWARGFEDSKRGKFAATFPYLKVESREQDFFYSDVLIPLQSRVFVRAGAKDYNFADIASLQGSTICSPLGWAPPPKLMGLITDGKLRKASPKNISTCVKMLQLGRADFFVTEERQGKAAIATSGVPPGSVVMADTPPIADNSLYLIAGKILPTSAHLIAAFNKGLGALHKSGDYDKIVRAHIK